MTDRAAQVYFGKCSFEGKLGAARRLSNHCSRMARDNITLRGTSQLSVRRWRWCWNRPEGTAGLTD